MIFAEIGLLDPDQLSDALCREADVRVGEVVVEPLGGAFRFDAANKPTERIIRKRGAKPVARGLRDELAESVVFITRRAGGWLNHRDLISTNVVTYRCDVIAGIGDAGEIVKGVVSVA